MNPRNSTQQIATSLKSDLSNILNEGFSTLKPDQRAIFRKAYISSSLRERAEKLLETQSYIDLKWLSQSFEKNKAEDPAFEKEARIINSFYEERVRQISKLRETQLETLGREHLNDFIAQYLRLPQLDRYNIFFAGIYGKVELENALCLVGAMHTQKVNTQTSADFNKAFDHLLEQIKSNYRSDIPQKSHSPAVERGFEVFQTYLITQMLEERLKTPQGMTLLTRLLNTLTVEGPSSISSQPGTIVNIKPLSSDLFKLEMESNGRAFNIEHTKDNLINIAVGECKVILRDLKSLAYSTHVGPEHSASRKSYMDSLLLLPELLQKQVLQSRTPEELGAMKKSLTNRLSDQKNFMDFPLLKALEQEVDKQYSPKEPPRFKR